MTLGNTRANGVRSLAVSCIRCHHDAVLDVEAYSDEVTVPSFGPRCRQEFVPWASGRGWVVM